ncbi:hypothetical protein JK635_01865 [Neobacillus sp. YIM B02564]|uniref:Major tail protein n=1 Tax=Neobacillus paridis TaxID=2803862 RepID=A0ABS1TM49_9BACI|nr:hypothetical protein [Neobacillus paridis]MBL4950985.1 hypothetical protein [Neobacillus paridis]
MTTPNRFAIRDAGEATFFNLQTGKAIVTLNTLKTSGVETSGETTYVRGGFGNPKLVGFSSNKEGKLTLQDSLFDKFALSMLTGNELTEEVKVIDYNEKLTVKSNKISLSKTPQGAIISVFKVNPIDGTNEKEYTLGDPATNPTDYSLEDKDLTFNTEVQDGTIFRVYYKVKTGTDAKTVRVSSDAFGGTFRVVVDLLVRDSADGKDYAAQLIIPRGKFEDSFSMNLSVDGDPAVLDLPIEILNDPLTNTMWEMVIYSETDIV